MVRHVQEANRPIEIHLGRGIDLLRLYPEEAPYNGSSLWITRQRVEPQVGHDELAEMPMEGHEGRKACTEMNSSSIVSPAATARKPHRRQPLWGTVLP
jgi:hypothetical protein